MKSPRKLLLFATLLFLCFQPLINRIAFSVIPTPLHWLSLFVCAASLAVLLVVIKRDSNAAESLETLTSGRAVPLRHEWLLVSLIILVGLFLRTWKLGSLFEGMAWNEAYKGLDGIAIHQFHERPVYLNWNAGKEAMIAYLVAFSQFFLNHTIASVRIVLALAGTLTILFYYLFLKRIFDQRLALIAAFLLAVSKWHIVHSRYAVRVALFPLFEICVLYLIVRGLNSTKRFSGPLILAGLLGGLGLYSYIAYRTFPVIVLLLLLQKDLEIV